MQKNHKKAVVIHSGGMDSSLCLALAVKEFGKDKVVSLSFSYHQRHSKELMQAKKICETWGIDHVVVGIDSLNQITSNALINHQTPIKHEKGEAPNTLVMGRNGLMARLGAIYAHEVGADYIYMGVMELEGANSRYRDCSRAYMDLKQQILKIDLDNPKFEIRTPVVRMTKEETMELAYKMGVLDFLLQETITCYEEIPHKGCQKCPACLLRNRGLEDFAKKHPSFKMPF